MVAVVKWLRIGIKLVFWMERITVSVAACKDHIVPARVAVPNDAAPSMEMMRSKFIGQAARQDRQRIIAEVRSEPSSLAEEPRNR